MSTLKKRIIYFFLFLILLIIECIIGVFVRDTFIRPYVGDILVVGVIYYFIRVFLPERVVLLPLYVFVFAAFVELLQYFRFADKIGLENKILRTIIGTSFSWADIICYAVGFAIIVVFDLIVFKMTKHAK